MYRLQGDVPFVLGLSTMISWKAKIYAWRKTVEVHATNAPKPIVILAPQQHGGHMKIELEPLIGKSTQENVFLAQKMEQKMVCPATCPVSPKKTQMEKSPATHIRDMLRRKMVENKSLFKDQKQRQREEFAKSLTDTSFKGKTDEKL